MTIEEQAREIRQVEGLGEISDRYDAILCDIWGVLHNGVASFAPASEALAAFRRRGGAVVLISNAPRPSAPIRRQLVKLGVSPHAFDAIATSGDVTIELIQERIGDPVLHIGPARDLSLFEAAAEATGRRPRLVAFDEADYALCTGLWNDETESPGDYDPVLGAMAAREMIMVCANPDIVIHRGDVLVYCAGALARRYEEIGGPVVYAGKPHAPIYATCLAEAETLLGRPVDRARVLAIGDGVPTDVAGANAQDLDVLFIATGIHGAQTMDAGGRLDVAAVDRLLAGQGARATWAMADLTW